MRTSWLDLFSFPNEVLSAMAGFPTLVQLVPAKPMLLFRDLKGGELGGLIKSLQCVL